MPKIKSSALVLFYIVPLASCLVLAQVGTFAEKMTAGRGYIAIAIVVLLLGAVSLSASIFLIEELNNPLKGFISVSRTPMDRALGYLGQ